MSSKPPSVLGKAVQILRAFTVEDTRLTFTQLLERTALPKATLHRTLADMSAAGLLERDANNRYRLSRFVFELGMRASVERTLLEVATPFLEDLHQRARETVHLGVREGSEVVYIAKIGGHHQAASPSRLGGRMPLHATAIGKALLAHAPEQVRDDVLVGDLHRMAPRTITAPGILREQLATILDKGVAFEYEESAVGIVCVAAPVLSVDGVVLAAVSVTGPVTRLEPRRLSSAVHAAAAGIAATLARRPGG